MDGTVVACFGNSPMLSSDDQLHPERQGQRYVKNKRPRNRGRGHGTQIESVYHPNHIDDEPSAQTRLVPVPCEVRAESDSTNAPTTPPPPSSKSNEHNLRRRATMTPPAKGRPRQPVPREVRADGQAGALPPHKTINGRRQSSNKNNAHNNSPPPNLHHHLRQRVMDNNPIINYHLGDDISANAIQINTKPPSHKRDIIRNHSPSLRSNSEGKEINRSADTNKGWQQPINSNHQLIVTPAVEIKPLHTRTTQPVGKTHQYMDKREWGMRMDKTKAIRGSRDWITSKGAGSVNAAPQRVHFYLK